MTEMLNEWTTRKYHWDKLDWSYCHRKFWKLRTRFRGNFKCKIRARFFRLSRALNNISYSSFCYDLYTCFDCNKTEQEKWKMNRHLKDYGNLSGKFKVLKSNES